MKTRTAIGWVAVLLLLCAGAPSHGGELEDIRKAILKNQSRIKTLRCKVEIRNMLPMGTVEESFLLSYKFPHLTRAQSIRNKESVYIARKDTAYFKNGPPKRMEEMLMTTVRADGQGYLFNPISFLDSEENVRIENCGKNKCLSLSGALSKEAAAEMGRADSTVKYSMKVEYSPRKKRVEGFTMVAGGMPTQATFKYKEMGRVQLPEEIVMQVQMATMRIAYSQWDLNGSIPDEEFK